MSNTPKKFDEDFTNDSNLDSSFNQGDTTTYIDDEQSSSSSSSDGDPEAPILQEEGDFSIQDQETAQEEFRNEKFVFSTRSSNLEKFQNLQNQKELDLVIGKFWELDIEERLEIIDNLDSIMTLVSSQELDNIILSLFGFNDDYLSKSVVNDFYTEDAISGQTLANEASGGKNVKLYRRPSQKKTRTLRDSNVFQAPRKPLNLMKADRSTNVTKQERLRKVRHNLLDFVFKENKLRKKMLRTFPLILQKIFRTRNESFLRSANAFRRKSFMAPTPNREKVSPSLPNNLTRFSVRGSYHHIPEMQKPNGQTISLKRLSNKRMLQENIAMLGYRDSDVKYRNDPHGGSDLDSDFSTDPMVEHEEEVRLLKTLLGFVIRRYREHKEIKSIILCFESMRQIFSFCPKKIFHLVGLETIINLLYNHMEKSSRSVFSDKKTSDFVDIDSLYDIGKSDELVAKFGKLIDHNNLSDCRLLLQNFRTSQNSTRRKNQSFFLSMEPPRGKRVSLIQLEKETCNPNDYLNIWLGIELSIHFFQKISFTKERQIALNNFDFASSQFFKRNSKIECQDLSESDREVFQSWQVFKEQVRKTIKDAVTRICIKKINPCFHGKISPEILKNFWPENKLRIEIEEADPDMVEPSAKDFVSQRIVTLLKHMDEQAKDDQVKSPSGVKLRQSSLRKKAKSKRSRNISKTSGYSAMMSRSEYENNNPFIRTAKMDKGRKGAPRKSYMFHNLPESEPLFDKECEQSLLYKQLIDEDKLENQNIQEFFKINHQTLPQHLLLLFMAHIDDLLWIMGPRKSIEFVLPVYFTILNVNSIYHCNYQNVNLEKKPKILRQKTKRQSKRFRKQSSKKVQVQVNSKREQEQEKLFQKSLQAKTLRTGILSNIKGLTPRKIKKVRKTIHNSSIGFYINVESFPSLENKISQRFNLFFDKFRSKILFQDQDIYKVALSKLTKVLRLVLKFSCSGIIDDASLNICEEKFGLYRMSCDMEDLNIKTKRASLAGSQDQKIPVQKEFKLGGLTQEDTFASPERKNRTNKTRLVKKMNESNRLREDSHTPKKKRKTMSKSKQSSQGDHSTLKIHEEYTYILQPFLCFIHSIHRIVFFLDYPDKCILFQAIFKDLQVFLSEFYFSSKLQAKLYNLRAKLANTQKSDNEFDLDNGSQRTIRLKASTQEIVGLYNNTGIQHIPREVLQKKAIKDYHIRLESVASFPYLLTLLLDLEHLFKELRDFFIGLNKESFFERIGLVSETKMKNRKRLHSLLVLKLCLAQNFVSFSVKFDPKQKSFLLDIMDKFYLSNSVTTPAKGKRGKQDPKAEFESRVRAFSQTNNLEIKMTVVRTMHFFLGPPINANLREKFAAHYTHIESDSKDNWRIRFSILSSLMEILNVFENQDMINRHILPVFIGLCQDSCAFLRKQAWQMYGLVIHFLLYSGNLPGFFFLIESLRSFAEGKTFTLRQGFLYMAFSCLVCDMFSILEDHGFPFKEHFAVLEADCTPDVRIVFKMFNDKFSQIKYCHNLYNLYSILLNQKNQSLVRCFEYIVEIYSEPIKAGLVARIRKTKLSMVTAIPEYNLLRLEAQVKIELALESCEKRTRSKATQHSVKLSPECLELSENELLMMEHRFDFHDKFSDYQKFRLSAIRKKKNSIIIVNREQLELELDQSKPQAN